MDPIARQRAWPLLLAHRGDHRSATENTLAAFQAAAAAPGCDGVELDVRLSGDGEAIVLHDATLDRVQGRSGAARDLTAGQLAGFGVPRLRDVLSALPPTFLVDVELKEPAIDAVAATLAAARVPEDGRTVVSSFDGSILQGLSLAAPRWPRWLISSRPREAVGDASDIGCAGVALEVGVIDERVVAECHRAGLTLMAWTVRDADVRDHLESLGVDAICAEGSALGHATGRRARRDAIERYVTDRLVATRIGPDDFDELSRLHHDPRVMATLGGIRSDDTTRDFIREKVEHWERYGFGMWMYHERETGAFVGRGALQHIEVGGNAEVEIGYTVAAERQGRGYATEMARAMVDLAFDVLGFTELVSFTLPSNLVSRRVMDKCGFTFERDIHHAGEEQVLYRLRRAHAIRPTYGQYRARPPE